MRISYYNFGIRLISYFLLSLVYFLRISNSKYRATAEMNLKKKQQQQQIRTQNNMHNLYLNTVGLKA